MYYTARLDQEVYEEDLPASPPADGLTVRREYFTTSAQRLEDGTLRVVPSKTAVNVAKSGQVLRCRLTLRAERPLTYVMVEDPIPSNCRIVDTDKPSDGYSWSWWWDRSVFTDEKAVFFTRRLEAGKDMVVEYALRAEAAGECTAMPATAFKMYQPDARVSTGGYALTVQRP